jgi:hypothetical protein
MLLLIQQHLLQKLNLIPRRDLQNPDFPEVGVFVG